MFTGPPLNMLKTKEVGRRAPSGRTELSFIYVFNLFLFFCLSLVATPSGCLYPGNIENGHVIPGKKGDILPPGQSLEFLCKDGYTLDGAQKVYCQTDETWSDINPVCVVDEGSEGTSVLVYHLKIRKIKRLVLKT